MIFWIILGILILLCLIPLGVRAVYNSEGIKLWLLIGPLRIFLFPKPKKPEEKKETSKKEKTTGTKKKPVEKEQKEGGSRLFAPFGCGKKTCCQLFQKASDP